MKPRADRKYRIEDNIGKKFGSRIVLGAAERRPGCTAQRWLTRCDCGSVGPTEPSNLLNGKALQCINCGTKNQTGPSSRGWRGGKHTPLTHFHKFKRSAARRGMEFSLSIGDIDDLYVSQAGFCALSGAALTFDHGDGATAGPGNASLDRIDSNVGYILGNVQLVTKDINMGKQSLTDEEFVAMCRSVVNYADRKQGENT